jgi:hypothetical protein
MLVFVTLICVPFCAKVVVNVKVKFPLSVAVQLPATLLELLEFPLEL